MDRTFSVKSPIQMVTAATITFMLLNALLPLNFSPVEAETTEYPFELTIALEKTAYRLGETVNVTWILTNIGEENVTLYHGRDHIRDFIVLDENFNQVYWRRLHVGRFLMILPYPPIAPGDNMTCTGFWSQIYDEKEVNFGVSPWVIKFNHVPPGTYYVSGIFESPTYDHIKLETPPIRITILGG